MGFIRPNSKWIFLFLEGAHCARSRAPDDQALCRNLVAADLSSSAARAPVLEQRAKEHFYFLCTLVFCAHLLFCSLFSICKELYVK